MNRSEIRFLMCGVGAFVGFGITLGVLTYLRPDSSGGSVATTPAPSPGRVIDPAEAEYRERLRTFLDECRSAVVLFGRTPTHAQVDAKIAAMTEAYTRVPEVVPEAVATNPVVLVEKLQRIERWGVIARFASANFLDPRASTHKPDVAWKELADIGSKIGQDVREVETMTGGR